MKTAIYDFSVSPYSFDFVQFVVAAKSKGCERIAFVPGERDYQKLSDMEQRRRFYTVLLPLAHGMSLHVCRSRDEARGIECAYPEDYDVDAPLEGHHFKHALAVNDPVPFQPSRDAVEYVRGRLGDRKPVVITIRETQRPARNSNIAAWLEFAKYAKAAGHEVVFVPDTDHKDREFGFDSWPEAAEDIHIRLALMDAALVNMGVANGPMMLAFFSKRPLLYLKPITDAHVETSRKFMAAQGLFPGTQPVWFTKAQRIVWEDDDANVICKAFDDWLRVQAGGRWEAEPVPKMILKAASDDEQRERNMAEALRLGFPRLAPASKTRDESISIVCYGPSLRDTWKEITRPIMSVSGAHDFLIERGIVPDYHLDSDPREHKAEFVRNSHPAVHYLMASCSSPKAWEYLKGRTVTVWHSVNSLANSQWLVKNDPEASQFIGGSTAGLRAIEVCGVMGFNRFRIFGMDSSYRFEDGETVTHSGAHNGKEQRRLIVTEPRSGRMFLTSPQLIEAAREFLKYIGERPIRSMKVHGDGLLQEMYFQAATQLLEEKRDERTACV